METFLSLFGVDLTSMNILPWMNLMPTPKLRVGWKLCLLRRACATIHKYARLDLFAAFVLGPFGNSPTLGLYNKMFFFHAYRVLL